MKWLVLLIVACATCGEAVIDKPISGDYTTDDGRNITLPTFLGFGDE